MGITRSNNESGSNTSINSSVSIDDALIWNNLSESRKRQEIAISQENEDGNASDSMWWLSFAGIISGVLCLFLIIGLIIFYNKFWKSEDDKNSRKSLWLPSNTPRVGTVKCVNTNSVDSISVSSNETGILSDSPTNFGDCLTSTKIQPERKSQSIRYKHSISSSSLAEGSSKGSDDEDSDGCPNNKGKLWFSAKYSFDEKLLYVEVLKAKYLKGRSMFYSPRDPFVRLYLLPDEITYYQTKVRYRTLSPKFKETFTFKIEYEECSSRSLKFVIYDFDKKNVRHSLGQAIAPLANLDLTQGHIVSKELDDFPQKIVYVGEIQISLSCNPYTDKMKVSVLRLKNLPVKNNGKTYTVYIRVDLYHGRRLVKSKVTSKRSIASVIEVQESFTYGISGRHLDACSLTLSVLIHTNDISSSMDDKTIGRLIVGPFMFARGRELLHWQEMLCNPRTTVEKWHQLCDVN
ncbi:synaptotagmin XV [Chamberlinius hualienensis]